MQSTPVTVFSLMPRSGSCGRRLRDICGRSPCSSGPPLALLTAARIGEVAGARKSEMQALDDPSRAAWLIPAARSKNKRPRLVPLSPAARDIVLELTAARHERHPLSIPTTPINALSCTSVRVGAEPLRGAAKRREEGVQRGNQHHRELTMQGGRSQRGSPPWASRARIAKPSRPHRNRRARRPL